MQSVTPKEQTHKVLLPPCWQKHLAQEFDKQYMKDLKNFLIQELEQGHEVFPHGNNLFKALELTPLSEVKVVIIGQDPYHGPGQAHGLSFSVPKGVRLPPSLRNIYKEISSTLKVTMPDHGCLEGWAKQGVLLLNSVLTVRKAQAGSHQKKGWENFTDALVNILNEQTKGLVFLLWGSHAQMKAANVDSSKHLVLKSVHPSPLSAHRGFFGSNHFIKTNEYLSKMNKRPIQWNAI